MQNHNVARNIVLMRIRDRHPGGFLLTGSTDLRRPERTPVYSADGRVWELEVKATQTPRSEHFTHLKKLRDRIGDRFRGGIVLNMHPRTVRMGPGFWSVPVSALWDH